MCYLSMWKLISFVLNYCENIMIVILYSVLKFWKKKKVYNREKHSLRNSAVRYNPGKALIEILPTSIVTFDFFF